MKIIMNARKATRKRSRGRVGKAVNHKQNYIKYGRKYYVRNRARILKQARARYAKNKKRYSKARIRWMRKTNNGKAPLYLSKGKGKRPVYPRLKPIHGRTARHKTAKKLWRSKYKR